MKTIVNDAINKIEHIQRHILEFGSITDSMIDKLLNHNDKVHSNGQKENKSLFMGQMVLVYPKTQSKKTCFT